MPFTFQSLEIPDVVLIEATAFADARGIFAETYKKSQFMRGGVGDSFVQDNFSSSGRGVLRGVHYQKPPKAQAKLVLVTRGEIFDVAVDIRQGSPSYGHWIATRLSADNRQMLYLPVGFAHGFCVVSEAADVVYKVTAEYDAELDAGIAWNDPDVGITWPIEEPRLSPKDAGLPLLREIENPFKYEA